MDSLEGEAWQTEGPGPAAGMIALEGHRVEVGITRIAARHTTEIELLVIL